MVAKSYEVKLLADEYLGEGWVKDADYDSKYVYTTHMRYGETITFWMLGKQFGETYTVTGDLTHDVFTLPEKKKFNDTVEGTWKYEIGENGATFTVVFDLDTVNYKSDLSFLYQDASTDAVTEQFNKDSVDGGVYKLIQPADITVDGVNYTFLGWFKETRSGWERVTEVTPSEEGAVKVNLTVQALWASTSLSVTVGGSRTTNGWGTKADHTVTATVNGFSLVGAPAASVKVDVNFRFWANNNTDFETTKDTDYTYTDQSPDAIPSSHSVTINKTGAAWNCNKDYGHAVVTFVLKDAAGNTLKTLGGDASLHGYITY